MASTEKTASTGATTPYVSVIIPTYNRVALLPRSINSVLAQTFKNFELIIVDDASTDATESIVREFDDPRIRYFRHENNSGGSAARNTGIAAARGELIAFQDSDDEWLPGKLWKQIESVKVDKSQPNIVYCAYILAGPGSVKRVPDARLRVQHGNILPDILNANFVGTPTLLFPRKCINAVGPFDEQLRRFQDWEFVIRLAAKFEFLFIDEPLVVAHETPGNISSNVDAAIEAIELIVKKHSGLFADNRKQLANNLVFLGQLKCVSGAVRNGRADFVAAIKAKKYSPEAWIGLALSFVGKTGFNLTWAGLKKAASVCRCIRTVLHRF